MSQPCLLCRAWTSYPKWGEITPKRFKNSTVVNSLLWVDMQSILTMIRSVGGHAVYSDYDQQCGWTCSLFCRSSEKVCVDMHSILFIIRSVGGHAVYSVDRPKKFGWEFTVYCLLTSNQDIYLVMFTDRWLGWPHPGAVVRGASRKTKVIQVSTVLRTAAQIVVSWPALLSKMEHAKWRWLIVLGYYDVSNGGERRGASLIHNEWQVDVVVSVCDELAAVKCREFEICTW